MNKSAWALLARSARSTRPYGLVEAGLDQRLLDHVGELEIIAVFGGAAGAVGAWHGYGMADVDDDVEG
jgi:hypothetical protein